MAAYDLKLEAADVFQILDALESRAAAYENTAENLDGEYTGEFFVPEECDNAIEANEIAQHFRDIITALNTQMEKQQSPA